MSTLGDNSKSSDALVNLPFFDFRKADEEYGIYELVSDNGFEEFIREKFLEELTELRGSFLDKNYDELKKKAHKIKSAFCYLFLYFAVNSATRLMNSKDEEIEKNYVDFVVKMRIIFEEICKFGERTNNLISKDQIKSFHIITNDLDSQEEKRICDQILSHHKELIKGLKNKTYKEIIKLPESKINPSQNTQLQISKTKNTNNNQVLNQKNVETTNNIVKTDTTVDSHGNISTQSQIKIKNKENEKHIRNDQESTKNLKEANVSVNNSGIIEDKKLNQLASCYFKSKSGEGEIVMESQEKRGCCKLNNCTIF